MTIIDELTEKYQEVLEERKLQKIRGDVDRGQDKLIRLAVTDVFEACKDLSNKDFKIATKRFPDSSLYADLRYTNSAGDTEKILLFCSKGESEDWFYKCFAYLKKVLCNYVLITDDQKDFFEFQIKE